MPKSRKTSKTPRPARGRRRKATGRSAGKRRPTGTGGIQESRIAPGDLAAALGVPAETVERHVAAGAPVDKAGRLHIAEYAAWLNGSLRGRRGS